MGWLNLFRLTMFKQSSTYVPVPDGTEPKTIENLGVKANGD